jgi:hypothetical protein
MDQTSRGYGVEAETPDTIAFGNLYRTPSALMLCRWCLFFKPVPGHVTIVIKQSLQVGPNLAQEGISTLGRSTRLFV